MTGKPGKRSARANVWGNWQGYLSGRRVHDFGTDERAALAWAAGGPEPRAFDPAAMGREVAEVVRQRQAFRKP